MTAINKKISSFIPSQFPDIYRTYGPDFIRFIKAYYEWLESPGNTTYHARRILDYGDIDTTVDTFLVHFKEKYLKNIQFDTATDTKLLVKHSLDLYRSKGTERAISLFFKLVYGEDIEIYYPGNDVFRTSDAAWFIPTYLEVTPSEQNKLFVNQEIQGLTSGALAFVEYVVTRRIKGKYIDIFYISGITKDFITGETISLYNSNTAITNNPIVTGSLTALGVTSDRGKDFKVGDIVNLSEAGGQQGKARVQSLTIVNGQVNFDLIDGGWGYASDAQVLISDKVLRLANVTTYAVNSSFLNSLETVVQPIANVQYNYLKYSNGSTANANFVVGDNLITYAANGSVTGKGNILSITTSNNISGYLLVSTTSGNLQSNVVFHNAGNVVTANLINSGFIDLTAQGQVIGLSTNTSINYANASYGNFAIGSNIFQLDSLGNQTASGVVKSTTVSGLSGTLFLNNTNGIFVSGNNIYSDQYSYANGPVTASVNTVAFDIGIITTNNTFYDRAGNYVYDPVSNINGTVSTIPNGSGATFQIGSLTNQEDVIITDYIYPYRNVALNAADYGAALHHANVSTLLFSALNFTHYSLGTIASLVGINPGSLYTYAPFVSIYEPLLAPLQKKDFFFTLSNATGTFYTGEIIKQSNGGGQGIVKFANSTNAYIRRITFEDHFVYGFTDTSHKIVGQDSGFTADLALWNYQDSAFAGLNDIIGTTVSNANGAVKELEVVDSGFGYINGENVTFTSLDGLRSGTAEGYSKKQGTGSGYNRTNGGFLSDNKYLYDGNYYQDFSYVIKTPINLDKYVEMLKQILHVAGTKYFSQVSKKSLINQPSMINLSAITIANGSSSSTRYYA